MPLAYATIPDQVPLVSAADLAGFRGAPFQEAVTQAAAESVRAECGWHIAPRIDQTVKIRTGGADTALLPSLMLIVVLSVVDQHDVPVTGWDEWEHGEIHRPGGFPDVIKVTFNHGYPRCPQELLGIIAERAAAQAAGRVKSESLAGRSVQLEGGYDPVTATTLNRYKLGPRP